MEPVVEKWKAFRWHTFEIDGHDVKQILNAVKKAKKVQGQPVMIIAHTIKGKGVSFMEGNNAFHGVAPKPEEVAKALKELS
jgi:transketolase